jgi:hypothetical protein
LRAKDWRKGNFHRNRWNETTPCGVEKAYPDCTMKNTRQFGITPANKALEITGVDIDPVIDGKIVEHGGTANTFGTFLNTI